MKISRVEWLRAAEENISYRRMTGLVLLMLPSSDAKAPERQLAVRLKSLLDAIGGQPIAPAAQLKRVSKRFTALRETVEINVRLEEVERAA